MLPSKPHPNPPQPAPTATSYHLATHSSKSGAMANLSDGEDSQMHDSPSSTPSPSTPPAALANPTEHLSLHSPPVEQTPPASQQNTPIPGWATKRSQDEAETAKEKVLDSKFSTKWLGDDLDESDMWKND